MISSIVSRLVILVFGTLYPAYASYKAVRTKNVREYVKWMMYWIVFALFSCAETFTDVFLSFWFPFYYEIKILLVLWLLSPATKGSSILYRKFVHPMLSRREQDIDEYIAKAKEQGYHTVLHLGTKGVNYATTVIMQTAIKGGGGLVQQLRRSYSLGDLSSDVDGDSSSGRKTLPEAQDRNRDRERVASGGDGRHHRPRGHSPRRSASGSGRVEMYFPEVDVDVRGTSVREPSVPLSHIRSSEDVSSGYSSAEPLYQQGGSVSGGQQGASRPDSLASSREPLVRTASVGGSSRSGRTRASRGAGGNVTKKGSATGATEANEENSLGEEDSSRMISPSPSRSRSNSLPASDNLLRPELVALLQALNAELEHKVSMSKLAEMNVSATTEQMEKRKGTVYSNEENSVNAVNKAESTSRIETTEVMETSPVNVSLSSLPDPVGIKSSIGSDDIFYDSVSVSLPSVPSECHLKDKEREVIEYYYEALDESGKPTILSDKGLIDALTTPSSSLASDMLPATSDQQETSASGTVGDKLLTESVEIPVDGKNKEALENGNIKSTVSSKDLHSLCSENIATAVSEVPIKNQETNGLCLPDETSNMSVTETVKQIDQVNQTHQEAENHLSHDRENCQGEISVNTEMSAGNELSYNKGRSLETMLPLSDPNPDANITEQILSGTDSEITSSSDRASTEEKHQEATDELQNVSDSKQMTIENCTFQDTLNPKTLDLSATDRTAHDHLQLKEFSMVESAPSKSEEIKRTPSTEIISNKNGNECVSLTPSNTERQAPEKSDSNHDPKKDIRSGKYHKLQAPEPPPRSRRSSSRSSISEDGDSKLGHRSRSPKKVAESPAARLHNQIENLASIIPFWHSGKQSQGKDTDGRGFRIRDMSRSPTRRRGAQAPPL